MTSGVGRAREAGSSFYLRLEGKQRGSPQPLVSPTYLFLRE